MADEPILERPGSTNPSTPPDPQAAANQWKLHELTGGKFQPTTPKPEVPKPAPPAPSAAEQREAERVAKLPPAEQRIHKANANPALWDPKHKDHEAARKELREAVAAAPRRRTARRRRTRPQGSASPGRHS